MKLTKKQLGEAKIKLMNRLRVICNMTREQLDEEIPKVCGFKSQPQNEDGELRYVLCQWALHETIPGSCISA